MSAEIPQHKPLARRLAMPLIMVAVAGLVVGQAYWHPADDVRAQSKASSAEPASDESTQRADVGVARGTRASAGEYAAAANTFAQLRHNMGGRPNRGPTGTRLIDDLESQHKAQSVDSSRSAQAEVDIMAAAIQPNMVKAGPSPQDFSAECRSRTCRISASFDSTIAAQNFGINLISRMGGTLAQSQMLLERQADGRVEVRVYGSRKPSGPAPVQSRPRSVELVASNQR
jgi:hypothetical protein